MREYLITPIEPPPVTLDDLKGYAAVSSIRLINGQWVTLNELPSTIEKS